MYNWHSGPNALATEPNDAKEREREKKGKTVGVVVMDIQGNKTKMCTIHQLQPFIIRGVSFLLRRFNSRRACRFPDYCAACFCSFVPFHLYSFVGRALYGWKFLHVSRSQALHPCEEQRMNSRVRYSICMCGARCLRGTLVIQTEKLL